MIRSDIMHSKAKIVYPRGITVQTIATTKVQEIFLQLTGGLKKKLNVFSPRVVGGGGRCGQPFIKESQRNYDLNLWFGK